MFMRRMLSALLAILLTLIPLCVQGEQSFSMMGYDNDSSGRVWENNKFFSRMAEKIGVSFTFEQYQTEEAYTKAMNELAAREIDALPDVLFKAELSQSKQLELSQADILIDLAPLLEANAPNLYKLLSENPQWEKAITLPDGKIVALPLINTMEHQVGLWVNTTWLKKLGMSMPTDPDSLLSVLKAFRDDDPNGNGKQDEEALNVTGVWEMRWLLGLFGIVADDYNLSVTDGKIEFAPELIGYYDFVSYLKMLHDEGLISNDAFKAMHTLQALEELESDTIISGSMVSFSPYSIVESNYVTDYAVVIPESGVWRDLLGEVWPGTFAITKGCDDPATVLAWVDEMYAPDATLAYAGIEGEDYSVDANGWSWILDDFRTVNDIRSESIIYTSGTLPGLMPETFMKNVNSDLDRHVQGQSSMLREISIRPLDAYVLTTEEKTQIDDLQQTLGKALDMGIAQFATGERELTPESWATFVDGLRALGSAELCELFEQVLAR